MKATARHRGARAAVVMQQQSRKTSGGPLSVRVGVQGGVGQGRRHEHAMRLHRDDRPRRHTCALASTRLGREERGVGRGGKTRSGR